jgi:hypothetical protein
LPGDEQQGASSRSCLFDIFPNMPHWNEGDLIQSLRMQNDSLSQRLRTSREINRGYQEAMGRLQDLISKFELEVRDSSERAKTREEAIVESSDEISIYVAVRGILRTSSRLIPAAMAGKKFRDHVLSLLTDHFWVMAQRAFMRVGEFKSVEQLQGNGVHYPAVKSILGNLLAMAFGVYAEDVNGFHEPAAADMTPVEEVKLFLKGAMMLRVALCDEGGLSLDLLHTFIIRWNQFAGQQIGMHFLPIQVQLGVERPHVPLRQIAWTGGVPFTFKVYERVHKAGKHKEIVYRSIQLTRADIAHSTGTLISTRPHKPLAVITEAGPRNKYKTGISKPVKIYKQNFSSSSSSSASSSSRSPPCPAQTETAVAAAATASNAVEPLES